jgi:glycosyltransferase involved in cell wall biosynthesis
LLQGNLDSRVRFSAYDEAFNFSAKCNAGAKVANGEILVFFNDDVRVVSADWIECLLDYLALDGVGAVAPKLLYENGLIQHAGIVTGVRRLLGTAFHCLPSDTTVYFNLAQSVRNVSVLSAACLAVRREVFDLIGGYDAVRFPIAHSDVDLCLKIRRAGFQCIFTPFATLQHIGHASLKETDKDGMPRQKDPADIHLLQDWPRETARDPFWNKTMRDILYADSPETFDIFPPTQPAAVTSGKNILVVFHDLSNSGAPRGVFEMAQHLIAGGHFVVAISPSDGFFREELQRIGATVIIDELILKAHPSVADFARNFDLAIANTVVSWPFVLQNAAQLDCYWYLHESHAIHGYANDVPRFLEALHGAKAIWVTGVYAKALSEDLRPDIAAMEYGIDPAVPQSGNGRSSPANGGNRVKIGVFGSYEPRKGQDLAVAAIKLLPPNVSEKIELNFFGRVLDQGYLDDVKRRALGNSKINFGPELPQAACTQELLRCDLVLISSRDEALSLVGLDAISAGKVVICSTAVGLSNYLQSGESAFIAKSPAPEDLASAIVEALIAKNEWHDIGVNAQNAFNRVFTKTAFRERIFRALSLS